MREFMASQHYEMPPTLEILLGFLFPDPSQLDTSKHGAAKGGSNGSDDIEAQIDAYQLDNEEDND